MDEDTQCLQKSVISKCPLCSKHVSGMDFLKKHVTDTHFMNPEVAKILLQLIDTALPESVKKPAINGTTIASDLSTSVTPVDKNEVTLDDSIDILREISSSNFLVDSNGYINEVFSCAVCSQTFIGVVNFVCHLNEMGHLNDKNMPRRNCSMGQELVFSHELYFNTSLFERRDSAPAIKTCSVRAPKVSTNEISAISFFRKPITTSHVEKTFVASKFQTSASSNVTLNSAPSIYSKTATPQFQLEDHSNHNSIMQQTMNLMQPTGVEPNLSPLSCSRCSSICSSQETLMQHHQLYCCFTQSSQSQIIPNLPQKQQMHKIKKGESFEKKPRLSLGLTESTPSPTVNEADKMQRYRFPQPSSGELNIGLSTTPSSVRHMSFPSRVTSRGPSLGSQVLDGASLVIGNQETTAQRQSNQHLKSISMGLPIHMNLGINRNLPFVEVTNMHTPLSLPMMSKPIDPLSIDPMLAGEDFDPHYFAAQQKRLQYLKNSKTMNDQFKVLRAYFEINNSPTEDQLLEMSKKSGLPLKVIKRWFQNMLLNERQKSKVSPYNFNNKTRRI